MTQDSSPTVPGRGLSSHIQPLKHALEYNKDIRHPPRPPTNTVPRGVLTLSVLLRKSLVSWRAVRNSRGSFCTPSSILALVTKVQTSPSLREGKG